QAEELIENTPEARQADRQQRHREGFEDVVWFRMDVGRRQNADPRWVLPLLCRRGHITRNEVGAIRIGPNETHFQVPRPIADKFAAALARTAGSEDGGDVTIELSPDSPRDTARQHRKGPGTGGPGGSGPRSGGPGGKKPFGAKSHAHPGEGPRGPGAKSFGGKGADRGNDARPRPQRTAKPGAKPWTKKPHRKGPGAD